MKDSVDPVEVEETVRELEAATRGLKKLLQTKK